MINANIDMKGQKTPPVYWNSSLFCNINIAGVWKVVWFGVGILPTHSKKFREKAHSGKKKIYSTLFFRLNFIHKKDSDKQFIDS